MFDSIFLQISILLGITVVIATITRMLRQPLLISYIISGLFAGPLLLNFINAGEHQYEVFAEFGIVLLLFIVGLSLNFDHLKKIGKVAVVTGVGQVVFTGFFGYFILKLLGFSPEVSLYLAIAITFSSTIIITKLLSDKKDVETVYGRYTVGLMLVQDVLAILLLFFLNSFTQDTGNPIYISFGILILKGLITISAIYFLSKFILPLILERVARSSEFLFLFTLAWCFGIASIAYTFGFSLETGAIIAGLSLGSSPYQPEISSRIRPLRDFFLILFFIILGSKMNLTSLQEALVPGGVLALFILIGNPLILYVLFRIMKFTRRNSFLAGVTAAQVSEFGFVLLFAGQAAGYISDTVLAIFTMTALVTIFVSSYLITYSEQVYRFLIPLFNLFGKDKRQQPEDDVPIYDAWVVGYHRMGWSVCQTLKEQGVSFAVIDYNPEITKQLQEDGIPAYFGDIADVEFLSELPLEHAKLIVSTAPTMDDQFTFVKYVRSVSKKAYVIANLTQTQHVQAFYEAGADYVMMPHILGGYRISEILQTKRLTRNTFKKLRNDQEKELDLRKRAKIQD